jgi:hypothetical protein
MKMKSEPTKKPMTYRDEVMTWGNQNPWKRLGIRVSHKISFRADEVKRDGRGNIVGMPFLQSKPCFGRPEAFFRHGSRTKPVKLPNGRIVKGTNHQCGRCPGGVRQACAETAWERVQSDAGVRRTFNEWHQHCHAHFGGIFTYTGTASRPWGAFKEAIAARGPFKNANDEKIEQWSLGAEERRKAKWRREKERQRNKQRTRLRAEQKMPTIRYFVNLQDERDRRAGALLSVLGATDQPKSRSRVPKEHRDSTARITANAWAVRELFREMGREIKPGTIARHMADNGLNAGVPYPTLKARIRNDLSRADECERDGIWRPFDPNADLKQPTLDEEDEADDTMYYSERAGLEATLPELDGDLRTVLREIELTDGRLD